MYSVVVVTCISKPLGIQGVFKAGANIYSIRDVIAVWNDMILFHVRYTLC